MLLKFSFLLSLLFLFIFPLFQCSNFTAESNKDSTEIEVVNPTPSIAIPQIVVTPASPMKTTVRGGLDKRATLNLALRNMRKQSNDNNSSAISSDFEKMAASILSSISNDTDKSKRECQPPSMTSPSKGGIKKKSSGSSKKKKRERKSKIFVVRPTIDSLFLLSPDRLAVDSCDSVSEAEQQSSVTVSQSKSSLSCEESLDDIFSL